MDVLNLVMIRFKTSMIRSNLCDFSDANILAKGTITVPKTTAAGVAVNNTNKKVIFKNCAQFTDCIIEKNNTQVHDGQKIDVVVPMYNLIEYSDAYSKTPLNVNGEIIDCHANDNNSALF